MPIIKGQLTWDAEGTEGGRYHSRKLHVPSDSSGLTIGRGYDMKQKSSMQVLADLNHAGIDEDIAHLLAGACQLSGDNATQFIINNQLQSFEITPEQQEALFELIYERLSQDVQRICNKDDCVAAYGAVNWDELHPVIRDVLVDLRFRGDYTPTSRKGIQKFVSRNDVVAFAKYLSNREYWPTVPQDRFFRRVQYIEANL